MHRELGRRRLAEDDPSAIDDLIHHACVVAGLESAPDLAPHRGREDGRVEDVLHAEGDSEQLTIAQRDSRFELIEHELRVETLGEQIPLVEAYVALHELLEVCTELRG